MPIRPTVSIGIPVYNGVKYLAETLESVITQTHSELEIIVADNASTDGTQALLARYAERDPRIRVIYNDVNVGAAGNYNLVLNEATADYFAWLSADDVLEPTFVQRNLELLLSHPDAVGAYAEAIRIDQDSRECGDYQEAMAGMHLDSPDTATRFSAAVLGFPAIVLFGVFRRQAMLDTPGHGAYIGGDRVFVSEMALKGRILKTDEPLFRRRVHADAYSAIRNTAEKARWFGATQTRAGRADVHRIREHHAALSRADIGVGSRLRCLITLYVAFPLVLGRSHAVGLLERLLALFGRKLDHSRYAS
jgi:glycosyltransferase involved in cell wall biosynthesis